MARIVSAAPSSLKTPAMIGAAALCFLGYLFVPLVIRFGLYKKQLPIKGVFLILIPMFVFFAVDINEKRDRAQQTVLHEAGLPYESFPHALFSPLLSGAMIASYYVLRMKEKSVIENEAVLALTE